MKISNSAKRLTELMETFEMTQRDVVARTGLSKSVISLYVNGKREPAHDNIFIISKSFNVDPAWLMGYDVPMRPQSVESAYSVENARLLNEIKRDGQLLEFLKSYMSLSDNGKLQVIPLLTQCLEIVKSVKD